MIELEYEMTYAETIRLRESLFVGRGGRLMGPKAISNDICRVL